jgi:hypothetical protein
MHSGLFIATRTAAPKGTGATRAYIERTKELVRRWHCVARPIQTSKKSRGLQHDLSLELARELRSVAVDLVNDHGMFSVAEGLLNSLRDVFAELPAFVHRLDDDTKEIGRLVEQNKRQDQEFEQWKQEIAFSCEIGAVFKNKLSISFEGVRWRDDFFPLNTITRIRWGGTRHSVNGIPTGTSYHICFGDKQRLVMVQTNEWVYKQITEKLWKAIGVRLADDLIGGIKRGERYQFGSATISDTGVEIIRQRLFSANERIMAKWSDVRIWNSAGCFVLGLDSNKRVQAALSYQDIDNVHVLETAIRIFFKKGGDRLSAAFPDG